MTIWIIVDTFESHIWVFIPFIDRHSPFEEEDGAKMQDQDFREGRQL